MDVLPLVFVILIISKTTTSRCLCVLICLVWSPPGLGSRENAAAKRGVAADMSIFCLRGQGW